MNSSVAELAEVHEIAHALMAGVADDAWHDATPCAEWDVAFLVRHQVMGNQIFAGLLVDAPADPQRLDAELREQDPTLLPAAFADSTGDLERAFESPGAMQRPVTLPMGEMPGEQALHLRLVETLVHGWDLAHATGQDPDFPIALVEREIEVSRALLQRIPAGHSPFGEPVPVPDAAPALDRLAALLGRTP